MEDSVFFYFNCNPKAKHTTDCVIRAVCAAVEKPWMEVFRALTDYTVQSGYMFNDERNYGNYLRDCGWEKQPQPKDRNGKRIKVKTFLQTFTGTAVINAGKAHVSYVSDGFVWDIWNCENEIIGNYWIKASGQTACAPSDSACRSEKE